ncbi:MAG: hypothetical protein E7297_05375 [Lachnospiraceae bacterium]|jgi:hypothetical protein|nr:hypothetical protein [Lachnospiraceae bacterium]
MAFCEKCGKEIPEGMNFCGNCGCPIGGEKLEKTKKKIIPVSGILGLVCSLIGFCMDNYLVLILFSIIGFLLAIRSLRKKERLMALAIIAIVVSTLAVLIGSIEQVERKKAQLNSSKVLTEKTIESQESKIAEKEHTIAEAPKKDSSTPKYYEFVCGGIRFEIPSIYEEKDKGTSGSTFSKDKYDSIGFSWSESTLDDETLNSRVEEIDEKIYSILVGKLDSVTSQSAESLSVAGHWARSYTCKGVKGSLNIIIREVYINLDSSDKAVTVIGIAKDSGTFNQEFDSVISSASLVTDEKDNDSSSTNVDKDLKNFLDEYEKYVDKYCDFMKKYYENPGDLTLLADYSDMVNQLSEYETALEKYDSSTMSTEDAAYYLEVTTRCTNKMANVLSNVSVE